MTDVTDAPKTFLRHIALRSVTVAYNEASSNKQIQRCGSDVVGLCRRFINAENLVEMEPVLNEEKKILYPKMSLPPKGICPTVTYIHLKCVDVWGNPRNT